MVEILLFVAGMTALAIEIFILPGFGLFGIGGLLMVITALVLASQTFIFPSNSEQLTLIAKSILGRDQRFGCRDWRCHDG